MVNETFEFKVFSKKTKNQRGTAYIFYESKYYSSKWDVNNIYKAIYQMLTKIN